MSIKFFNFLFRKYRIERDVHDFGSVDGSAGGSFEDFENASGHGGDGFQG